MVLDGVVNDKAQMIQVGSIGVIDADDRHSGGYYMLELESSSYKPYKNKTIDGQGIEYGELVANKRYLISAISYSRWYVKSRDGNIENIISLRTVIKRGISVRKTRSISELPPFIKTIK